jgi:hypothetical protein
MKKGKMREAIKCRNRRNNAYYGIAAASITRAMKR